MSGGGQQGGLGKTTHPSSPLLQLSQRTSEERRRPRAAGLVGSVLRGPSSCSGVWKKHFPQKMRINPKNRREVL